MLAPAEEQSAVAPFFDRSRPLLGSLGPPLSDRPIPRSHAAVTILLPAMPQLATVPTNSNGTAPSAPSSAAHAVAGATIASAPATKKLPTTVLCPIDFKRNIRYSLIFSSSLSILRLSEPHALFSEPFRRLLTDPAKEASCEENREIKRSFFANHHSVGE